MKEKSVRKSLKKNQQVEIHAVVNWHAKEEPARICQSETKTVQNLRTAKPTLPRWLLMIWLQLNCSRCCTLTHLSWGVTALWCLQIRFCTTCTETRTEREGNCDADFAITKREISISLPYTNWRNTRAVVTSRADLCTPFLLVFCHYCLANLFNLCVKWIAFFFSFVTVIWSKNAKCAGVPEGSGDIWK